MKRLLVQWLIASGVAIAAFWPLASREGRGPWLATHVVIPMAIAVVALLVFRILRSLMVAVLCALAAAGVIVLLLRSYGDQVHSLFQAIFP
jgi:hypothetical protein